MECTDVSLTVESTQAFDSRTRSMYLFLCPPHSLVATPVQVPAPLQALSKPLYGLPLSHLSNLTQLSALYSRAERPSVSLSPSADYCSDAPNAPCFIANNAGFTQGFEPLSWPWSMAALLAEVQSKRVVIYHGRLCEYVELRMLHGFKANCWATVLMYREGRAYSKTFNT